MKSEQIMKSDVLDIIFENRNKAYGAYILRKFYPDRIKFSLLIMFIVAAILSAFTFVKFKSNNTALVNKGLENILATIPKDLEVTPKKEIKPQIRVAPAMAADKFTNKFFIVAKNEPTDELPQDLEDHTIATSTSKGTSTEGVLIKDPGPSSGGGGGEPIVEEAIDPNIPIENADVDPSYPGGLPALRKFLEKNLITPTAMESGEEVGVNIKFVVGYDGKLKSFVVLKSGGDEFDNEVIRVLKKMPQWNPGRSHGKDVSVYTTIPVKFVGSE